ncbi:serine acetyltransferase [Chloropicon primus]|nr:serine acetyltransferase [Chloropicon primus]UPQ99871.1 serine acetyltransferase [Chloropicon primus]|eukprot:QDZ20659.1 serine acetyltransferase [Chloropicon primus]
MTPLLASPSCSSSGGGGRKADLPPLRRTPRQRLERRWATSSDKARTNNTTSTTSVKAPPNGQLKKEGDCSWAWDDHHLEKDNLWATIREEIARDSKAEPICSSFLFSTVLAHNTIEESLAFILANKLDSPVLPATQLMQLFLEAFKSDEIRSDFLADLLATYDRDPACKQYSSCLLYYKGFHAVQTHRVAHYLYRRGRASLAILLQSRASETFHVDIHPNATVGKGVMLDHATGVVMGESTVVGDNVSLLHHVTLGGSGKSTGDRHPKIGSGVLIGAGAVVLGNVKVGNCSKIGAGSVVLADVPPRHVAVGVPARNIPLVGSDTTAPVQDMNQLYDI